MTINENVLLTELKKDPFYHYTVMKMEEKKRLFSYTQPRATVKVVNGDVVLIIRPERL
jgi:hypothetical protein